MNRTTKSRKKSKRSEKRKLSNIGNIGSGNHQTSRDEIKKLKKDYLQANEKTTRKQTI